MLRKDSMKRYHWKGLCRLQEAFHLSRAHLRGPNATAAHTHDFAELFWLESGQALHRVNGRESLLARNTLVFIRRDDCHALASDSGTGFVIVNLAFPADTLTFLKERYFKGETRWFWKPGAAPDTLPLDRARLTWLAQHVRQLDGSERSQLDIELFLLELLRELRDTHPPEATDEGPEWLRESLSRLTEPEVLAGGTVALARLAGRTPQHLNATIKRFRGMTATEALNQARMDMAARELRTSTKKIIEVCFDCGLENLAHFYKLFRRHLGTTPRLYRQRHHAVVR